MNLTVHIGCRECSEAFFLEHVQKKKKKLNIGAILT